MKKLLTFSLLMLSTLSIVFARTYSVSSPDGHIVYEVAIAEKITFAAFYNGKTIIHNSEFGLQFSQSPYLGANMIVADEKRITDQ
ncbi:MAG: glycoside hydrolase family 97 N-terminal domain-containing protein [Cyclobacteriaceae bacterium]|nr:glycoside hydrolase family 97 N-terminal domain-containing protein [Cyclobacteriaceae bacterium]